MDDIRRLEDKTKDELDSVSTYLQLLSFVVNIIY